MPRNLKLLKPIYSLVIADHPMSGRTSYVQYIKMRKTYNNRVVLYVWLSIGCILLSGNNLIHLKLFPVVFISFQLLLKLMVSSVLVVFSLTAWLSLDTQGVRE